MVTLNYQKTERDMKSDKRWRGVPLGSKGRYRTTIVRDVNGLFSVWLAGKDGTCMVLDKAEAVDLSQIMIDNSGPIARPPKIERVEHG